MTVPQENIKREIQIDGRRILRTMLLGTSNKAYGGKKTVKAILYFMPYSLRSSYMPAIFAFPTNRAISQVQLLVEHTHCCHDQ